MEGRPFIQLADAVPVEQCQGVTRRTLSYCDEVMMCQFELQTGATIPLHAHVHIQNGYMLSGSMKFLKEDGTSYIVQAGDSYVFGSNEPHGVVCLEHAVVVENFLPVRREFI